MNAIIIISIVLSRRRRLPLPQVGVKNSFHQWEFSISDFDKSLRRIAEMRIRILSCLRMTRISQQERRGVLEGDNSAQNNGKHKIEVRYATIMNKGDEYGFWSNISRRDRQQNGQC